MSQVVHEQFAAHVQEPALTPDGGRNLLGHGDGDPVRPAACHRGVVDPGQRADRGSNAAQIHAKKPGIELVRNDGLDLQGGDALERPADLDGADVTLEQTGADFVGQGHRRKCDDGRHDAPDAQLRQPELT